MLYIMRVSKAVELEIRMSDKPVEIAERWKGEYEKNLTSPFKYDSPMICKMIRELSSAEGQIRQLREALKAWEHWYSEDSTEFNRDMAREAGLRVLDSTEPK
jgi:hypothetical protein